MENAPSTPSAPKKRNPKEPPPLVLMNPELRVRQLRYAANIEAYESVPLSRYYDVLLDLSVMGLEYLKSLKLERAFIIFKRIEFFIHYRLINRVGFKSFTSPAKTKIMSRLPMIMFVAQQIIVEFVMPVYERQAVYFKYEELQRRLRLLNVTAWSNVMVEAMRREAEFYSEAEKISTRFGVELSSFLPEQIVPDDNHPSNYLPRTIPAQSHNTKKQAPFEQSSVETAMDAAINSINSCPTNLPVNSEQPIGTLIRDINTVMNNALSNFFNKDEDMSSSVPTTSGLQISQSTTEDKVNLCLPNSANERNTFSPGVKHMYMEPPIISAPRPRFLPPEEVVASSTKSNRLEYNPKISLDSYINLLVETFKYNSPIVTGYRVLQVAVNHLTSPSTAGFMLHLEPVDVGEQATPTSKSSAVEGSLPAPPTRKEPMQLLSPKGEVVKIAPRSKRDGVPIPEAITSPSRIVPEPDPGPPRVNPPTEPLFKNSETTESDTTFGVWSKRGVALGPEGLGSLKLLSDLQRAREVLDSVPPMPERGIKDVENPLPNIRKRVSDIAPSLEEIQQAKRKSMEEARNIPGPTPETDPPS